MPLRLASSREQPAKAMTPAQEAHDARRYKLTRIIEGDFYQVEVTEYKSAENMAAILAETFKRRGLADWALFIEDQYHMMYHHEWRNGALYHDPDQAAEAVPAKPGDISHYVDGEPVYIVPPVLELVTN